VDVEVVVAAVVGWLQLVVAVMVVVNLMMLRVLAESQAQPLLHGFAFALALITQRH
jgi:hypothetical protein